MIGYRLSLCNRKVDPHLPLLTLSVLSSSTVLDRLVRWISGTVIASISCAGNKGYSDAYAAR